jgi:hypothetical protein
MAGKTSKAPTQPRGEALSPKHEAFVQTRARLRGAQGRGHNPDQPARQVLQSRVLVIDSATLPPEARLAVAEVSQTANGFRVKMHDKHAALVSIGKHLGMFTDQVQVRARYAISDEPMSAEEWKKQFVREG